MSSIGKRNFHHRPAIADAVSRAVLLGREMGVFFADSGSDVLRPEQAYELGVSGPCVQWRRKGRRWVPESTMPPVGVDCLRALDAGRVVAEARQAELDAECQYDFGDTDWCDEDYGPMWNVHAAFFEAECEQSRQESAAWERHECGGVATEDLPVFMTRVTA